MEQEEIIKSYDPVIMRRLFTFLKPYGFIAAVAVTALLLATGGELLVPLVLQRTIDNYILVSYSRIEPGREAELYSGEPELERQAVAIGGNSYIADHRMNRLQGTDREALRQAGILSAEKYFVFPVTDDPAQKDLIARESGSIEADGRNGVISAAQLEKLPEDDVRAVKRPYLGLISRSALILLAVLLSVLLFTFLQIYLTAKIGQDVMRDMRIRLFDHIIRQSLGHLSKHPVGRLVTRATNDVETVNELFTSVATSLLADFSTMAGIIVMMFVLNVRLGLIAVLTLPPVLVVTIVFRSRAREAFRKVRLQVSKVNSFLSEHISGISVVQTFIQEDRNRREFATENNNLMKANLGEMYVMATFRPVVDFLSSLSLATVLYFGSFLFTRNIVSLGILIAFLDLIRRFFQPVMDISEKFTIMQSAMAGGERVFGLLDEDHRIEDTGTGRLDGNVRGDIRFENVSFSYKEGEPVLRNLSFHVEPGETVAIVGYTGAGKTTIANLLTRLWDIDSGGILIDGTDIRAIPLSDLRRAVLPVQQDVFIFTGSVEENISLGSGIDSLKVREASRIVQADTFISRLPGEYSSLLAEGGTNISTGQRQLLSFARVIAHDPKIIIMDEATGNIDTETEKLIQKGIRELVKNRTSLIIAHRLSTIRHANRILVLSEGRLVEEGSHDELLKKGGVYYNLYRLQYAENGSEEGETGASVRDGNGRTG